jgi:hypothetical protein
MDIIDELDKLSLTVDFMTEQQAGQVNGLITTIISKVSPPHIIDVLWKRVARQGHVVLEPLPYLCRDTSRRGGAQLYLLQEDQTGLWAWAYYHDKPVCVKDIKRAGPNALLRDEATGEKFDPRRLDIYRETDSIMVVPLKIENVLCGLYSVEWPTSERLSFHSLKLLEKLAQPLARICWKVENLKIDQQQTIDAIRLFGDSIHRAPIIDLLSLRRTGFIARPFDAQFDGIEDYLREFFQKKGIQVQRYEHTPGRGVVVDEILKQIRASHFGVADVTGSNPNVLIELGALQAYEKRVVLLRREDDDTPLPFDISPFYFYSYTVQNERIMLSPRRGGEPKPLDSVLEVFVEELEADASFLAAEAVEPPPRLPPQSQGR